jgi:hypothetical protein
MKKERKEGRKEEKESKQASKKEISLSHRSQFS